MGAELLASVCVLEAALEQHAELSDQLLLHVFLRLGLGLGLGLANP